MNMRIWLLTGAVFFLLSPAAYSDVKKIPSSKSESRDLIVVSGQITGRDLDKFRDFAVTTDNAIVVLASPGGLLKPALEIGKIIRLKGYSTAVYDASCASACALIWLAGEPRMMTTKSGVGFHGAYLEREDGRKVSASVGNALVGSYLASMGFGDRFIAYVTAASPSSIEWLSKKKSEDLGLAVTYLENKFRAIADYDAGLEASKRGDSVSVTASLYRKSANDGFAGAQNNLGDLYESGRGVPKNTKSAVYWYTRAAERGEPTAYLSLATFLSEGDADVDTLVEALKFAYLAVAQLPIGKNKKAATAAALDIESRLPKEKVSVAKLLAKNWEPLYQETYTLGDKP